MVIQYHGKANIIKLFFDQCNMVTFLENRLKTVNSGMSAILSFEADKLKDVKGTSTIICNYLDDSGYSLSSLTRLFNPEKIIVTYENKHKAITDFSEGITKLAAMLGLDQKKFSETFRHTIVKGTYSWANGAREYLRIFINNTLFNIPFDVIDKNFIASAKEGISAVVIVNYSSRSKLTNDEVPDFFILNNYQLTSSTDIANTDSRLITLECASKTLDSFVADVQKLGEQYNDAELPDRFYNNMLVGLYSWLSGARENLRAIVINQSLTGQ
jgi:hypothetical protein